MKTLIGGNMQNARDYLAQLYLDMVNNYLSLEKFAEHNGITEEQAADLYQLAKSVFNTEHPDK